jgi:asparagine synthase (glutamine-hydrolysing)
MTPSITIRFRRGRPSVRRVTAPFVSAGWRGVPVADDAQVLQDTDSLYCKVSGLSGRAIVASSGSQLLLVAADALTFDDSRHLDYGMLGSALERDPADALRRLSGAPFTFYADCERGLAILAADRVATRGPCYSSDGETLIVGLTASDVVSQLAGELTPGIRSQALHDYVYSHVITAPQTIFEGVMRLLPGEYLHLADGRQSVQFYWTPRYDVTNPRRSLREAKAEFRDLLKAAVTRQLGGRSVGTFLSGGTDSSTVAGTLADVAGEPARTYSMGFDVAGFDEMSYARIAARHFGTQHHEYYLTPDDLLSSIPIVAASYDQPFGNSSVIPAYFCARLARADGIQKLLGGDGGDEVFGGNTRYARQKVLDAYGKVPVWFAERVIESVLLRHHPASSMPLLRKARSYVEQAKVPMPARMHTYNLVERIGRGDIFEPAFLAAVRPQDPAVQQDAFYARCEDPELVNRMLHFDWKYTLADNDLPKVVGACDLAGVSVGFPFLDERIVAFGNGLPADWKVRGLRLRYFFKYALADYLPRAIIVKRKHGFGMPFGHWLTTHAGLRSMTIGSLESLRDRGIVRRPFFDQLLQRVANEHATFYGELVWILMMMEQWLASHRPRYRFGGPAP